ncbi:hypothetical protein ACVGXB_05335, partial [Enterobacter intestinihominis]
MSVLIVVVIRNHRPVYTIIKTPLTELFQACFFYYKQKNIKKPKLNKKFKDFPKTQTQNNPKT